MEAKTWAVAVDGETVTATFEPATTPAAAPVYLLAHGAGGHMADRGVLATAHQLRGRGLHVVRFNFPYAERRSRRPDAMPLLQACIAAVAATARREVGATRWLLGGRSMGGRAA